MNLSNVQFQDLLAEGADIKELKEEVFALRASIAKQQDAGLTPEDFKASEGYKKACDSALQFFDQL